MSTACPLCTGTNIVEAFTAWEYLFRTRKYSYFSCDGCSHVFVHPMPTGAELEAFYVKAIEELRKLYPVAEDFRADQLMDEFTEREKVALLEEKDILSNAGRVLDIGFGRGGFLMSMAARGWDATGVEFTDDVSLLPGVEGRFNVRFGEGALDGLKGERFDLITMWHVMEHLTDPVSVLHRAHDLLADDGSLVIAVPNFQSLSRRVFGDEWYGAIPPWHLHQFTPKTVSFALARAGFIPREILGFGRMEESILWIESFDNKFHVVPSGAVGKLRKLVLRVLRRGAAVTMPVLLRLEKRLGSPSAIVTFAARNPMMEKA